MLNFSSLQLRWPYFIVINTKCKTVALCWNMVHTKISQTANLEMRFFPLGTKFVVSSNNVCKKYIARTNVSGDSFIIMVKSTLCMPNNAAEAGNISALADNVVTLTNELMFDKVCFPHSRFCEKSGFKATIIYTIVSFFVGHPQLLRG